MSLPGHGSGDVEMKGERTPFLREDAGDAAADAVLVADPRQQQVEFRGDARPRLLLQHALAQHVFEVERVADESRTPAGRRERVRSVALDPRLEPRRDAVVELESRRDERVLRALPQIPHRPELNLHLPGVGHRGVGAVERSEGERRRRAKPSDEEDSCRRASHGDGRKTQIAAGVALATIPPDARTPTKSRSSSGTNNEVRAPELVGTRANRT